MEKVRLYYLNFVLSRRWCVLTKDYFFSFKEERIYRNPTEIIPMDKCKTVKSVEDEVNKKFAFVRLYFLFIGFLAT